MFPWDQTGDRQHKTCVSLLRLVRFERLILWIQWWHDESYIKRIQQGLKYRVLYGTSLSCQPGSAPTFKKCQVACANEGYFHISNSLLHFRAFRGFVRISEVPKRAAGSGEGFICWWTGTFSRPGFGFMGRTVRYAARKAKSWADKMVWYSLGGVISLRDRRESKANSQLSSWEL